MKRRELIRGGLGALGVGLLAGPMAFAQSAQVDTSRVEEMVMGNADAPVTVIEYGSFTCPHCANFHTGPFQQLKANYIETGKVRFIYREVYFDRVGLWAGMVARCGGADSYFDISDRIYVQQSSWAAGGSANEILSNLARIGMDAGLSEEQIGACLNDGEMAEALVAVFEKNAAADGIRSTPSFVIDGELHSNMSYAAFADILDAKLGI